MSSENESFENLHPDTTVFNPGGNAIGLTVGDMGRGLVPDAFRLPGDYTPTLLGLPIVSHAGVLAYPDGYTKGLLDFRYPVEGPRGTVGFIHPSVHPDDPDGLPLGLLTDANGRLLWDERDIGSIKTILALQMGEQLMCQALHTGVVQGILELENYKTRSYFSMIKQMEADGLAEDRMLLEAIARGDFQTVNSIYDTHYHHVQTRNDVRGDDSRDVSRSDDYYNTVCIEMQTDPFHTGLDFSHELGAEYQPVAHDLRQMLSFGIQLGEGKGSIEEIADFNNRRGSVRVHGLGGFAMTGGVMYKNDGSGVLKVTTKRNFRNST